MLSAHVMQNFLRQFEPLKEVMVSPQSELVIAPNLVRVHGTVLIYGQAHDFEADLDLNEFGGQEDMLKLAKQLLTSFAGAAQHINASAIV